VTPGDRAKWLGQTSVPPPGASVDYLLAIQPTPTVEDRYMARNLHVEVVRVDGDLVRLVRADDGFEFDPSVDPALLVPASYEGWEHPRDPWRRAGRGAT
jgi:hypothetical protein